MKRIEYTSLLYSQPSFADGISCLLDFGSSVDEYNYSSSSEEADRLALMSDWYAVGADLFHSIERYKMRNGRKLTHG